MGFILEDKKTGRIKMASDKSMIGKKSTGKGRNAAPRDVKPFRKKINYKAGGGKMSKYYSGGGTVFTGRD